MGVLYVCVVILFTLDVRFVDVPAGVTQEEGHTGGRSHRRKVTQEEGHTGFLHLPSGVLALIFIARRIQPFLSLVDREVKFCVPTK